MERRLAQANGRLKAAKVGVKIETIGNRLYLRAVFPPRPNSTKTHPFQQRLSLGYHVNPAGLKLAEQEARKIGALLDCGDFLWNPYLKQKDKPAEDKPIKDGPVEDKPIEDKPIETVGDWILRFEEDYFTRRARTPKSETTWRFDYLKVFSKLPADQSLTPQLLKTAITATQPDTRTRKRFVDVCTRLAKFAELEVDFTGLKGCYSPKRVSPRNLPEDKLVAEQRERIPSRPWQYAYGLLATYGLRPHELFHCDLTNFPILEVGEGKTGSRKVYPFYPEWCELWKLNEGTLPAVTGRTNSDLGNRVTHAFKRYAIPFAPYDLRHAWAVRSMEFGLDVSLSAQQMGHSVKVHTEIYYAWISDEVHQRAYEALINNSNRPTPPQL